MKKYFENQKYMVKFLLIWTFIIFSFIFIFSHNKIYSIKNDFGTSINFYLKDFLSGTLYKREDNRSSIIKFAIRSYKKNKPINQSSLYITATDDRIVVTDRYDNLVFEGPQGSYDEEKVIKEYNAKANKFSTRYLSNMDTYDQEDPQDIENLNEDYVVKGVCRDGEVKIKDNYEKLKGTFGEFGLSKNYMGEDFVKDFKRNLYDIYKNINSKDIKSLNFYYAVNYKSKEFSNFINTLNSLAYTVPITEIFLNIFALGLIIFAFSFKNSKLEGKFKEILFKIPLEIYILFFLLLLAITFRVSWKVLSNVILYNESFIRVFNKNFNIYLLSKVLLSLLLFLLVFLIKDLWINRTNSKVIENSAGLRLINAIQSVFGLGNLNGIKLIIIFVFLFLLGVFAASVFGIYYYREILIICWLIFLVFVFLFIYKNLKEFKNIIAKTEKMKYGNFDDKIKNVRGFDKLSDNLNNINSNLQNAVNDAIKSEKLKSELITNVSHDLKTPLTSIINYSELLKNNDLKEEDIKKYSEIIFEKSIRIKNLIEDLFEISKISSGVIEIKPERIDLKEMLYQVLGEWQDKFDEKHLEIKLNLSDQPIILYLDANKTQRVLDNIMSNIYKYALNGTRVYIDLIKDVKLYLIIKNIANYELNIDSQSLFERFTRADSARNSEGSGIGLSIAKSFVEAQGGKFNISIDGDLFKQTITF